MNSHWLQNKYLFIGEKTFTIKHNETTEMLLTRFTRRCTTPVRTLWRKNSLLFLCDVTKTKYLLRLCTVYDAFTYARPRGGTYTEQDIRNSKSVLNAHDFIHHTLAAYSVQRYLQSVRFLLRSGIGIDKFATLAAALQ